MTIRKGLVSGVMCGRLRGLGVIPEKGRQALWEQKIMRQAYHKCHFCGGKVSEQKVTVNYR